MQTVQDVSSRQSIARPRRLVANDKDLSYCKTLNVSVHSISQISRDKQNREIKGREYQLQAKIGRNYYSISNCMVLIRYNKRGQNNFAC